MNLKNLDTTRKKISKILKEGRNSLAWNHSARSRKQEWKITIIENKGNVNLNERSAKDNAQTIEARITEDAYLETTQPKRCEHNIHKRYNNKTEDVVTQ